MNDAKTVEERPEHLAHSAAISECNQLRADLLRERERVKELEDALAAIGKCEMRGGPCSHCRALVAALSVSNEMVRVVSATQSPVNKKRWGLDLECGCHNVWVTASRKPKRGPCRELSSPEPT